MILSILQHTPIWVYAIFVTLVVLGVQRLRTADVAVSRLLLVPIVMTGLSLYGLTQTFGIGVMTIFVWGLAFAAALVTGRLLPPRSGVQYSAATRTVRVPGSGLPLALMMTIFFLRYVAAVSLGMHPALHADTTFVTGISALYGVSSGAFGARTLRIWRAAFASATPTSLAVAA